VAHGLLHLRFSCSNCGHCCRDLRVPLTLSDARNLPRSALAWLSPDAVDMTGEPESFVELEEGRRLLALQQRGGACVFLAEDRCTLYTQRPRACRLYPFDVSLGRKHGIRRLKLLEPALCSGDTAGWTNPARLARQQRTHHDELEEHVAAVQRFNRKQRHRHRMGLPLLSAEHFLQSNE
jgi:Fe-S-cluster containining protein